MRRLFYIVHSDSLYRESHIGNPSFIGLPSDDVDVDDDAAVSFRFRSSRIRVCDFWVSLLHDWG